MRKFQVAGARFAEVGVSHYPRPHGRSQFFRLPAIARSARQLLRAVVDAGPSDIPPMTVLVTGGAGYIGSHTVRALRDAGREVVVLDSLELGRVEALLGAPFVARRHPRRRPRPPGVRRPRRHGDRPLRRLQVRRRVDAVAGQVLAATTSTARPRSSRRRCAPACATSCSRRRARCTARRRRCRSSSRRRSHPESVYADSKAMVERILHWYGVTKGLRSASLRYFNAAGASHDAAIGEDWTFSINLIPLVMKAVLGAGPPVQGVRRRLPDARRDVHPRLHPRRGPRRRPHPGARPAVGRAARRRPLARRQPRDRRRVVRARRDQGDGGGRRAAGARTRSSPGGPATRSPPTPTRRTPSPCSAGGRSRASPRSSRPPTAGTPRAERSAPASMQACLHRSLVRADPALVERVRRRRAACRPLHERVRRRRPRCGDRPDAVSDEAERVRERLRHAGRSSDAGDRLASLTASHSRAALVGRGTPRRHRTASRRRCSSIHRRSSSATPTTSTTRSRSISDPSSHDRTRRVHQRCGGRPARELRRRGAVLATIRVDWWGTTIVTRLHRHRRLGADLASPGRGTDCADDAVTGIGDACVRPSRRRTRLLDVELPGCVREALRGHAARRRS